MNSTCLTRTIARFAAIAAFCLLAFLPEFSARATTATVTLVPAGSIWNYLDDGSAPAPDWVSIYFDDIFWQSGSAKLGYGNGDEETELSYGPDARNRYVTYYFRQSFVVEDAAGYTDLTLSLLRDDGAVVYLNGSEVLRSNMPLGPIGSRTLALTNVGPAAELLFFTNSVHPSFLAEGTNVLAVEVHQFRTNSADLGFDLQLTGTYPVPLLVRGPYLQQGTPRSVIVKWRTDLPTPSRVLYGNEASKLKFIAEDIEAVTEHQVRLAGLEPDTRYFYAIAAGKRKLAGDSSFNFVTAPTLGKPTRVWVLGDSGTANSAAARVRDAYYAWTADRETDLWLMLGDNAYGSGTDAQYQAAVFDFYPTMLRQSVLWPTIGNHETYSTPPGGELPYLRIFSLPTQGEAGGVPSGTERYYSFNYGNIHFICLDSMTSLRARGSPMLTWLQADLGANTNDWTIAFWHHPPYTKGSHDSDFEIELIQMRENALPLLESYGVDLVLCGHSHCYERSYLLDHYYGRSSTLLPEMIKDGGNGNPDQDGPYLKTSTGLSSHEGAVYVVAGSSGQTGGGSLDHPAMFVSLNELGSLALDITGQKLAARFIQDDGLIGDHFEIWKGMTRTGLKIVSLTSNGGFLTLRWQSEPGQVYRVERTPSLESPDWQVVEDNIPATGSHTVWLGFLDPFSERSFYRVVRH